MRRKTALASAVLSAALILSACGNSDTEDPLGALQDSPSGSSNPEPTQKVIEFDDGELGIVDPDEFLSPEEISALEEELQANAPAATDEVEPENTGSSNIHDKNFGFDFEAEYFNVDIGSIEIPEEIKESYSDYDTDRIVPSLLEAFDWARNNTDAKTKTRNEENNQSLTEYMSGYLSEQGEELFFESLQSGQENFLLAFSLLPHYYETITFSGETLEIAKHGYWDSGIGNVEIMDPELSQNMYKYETPGVPVTLSHSVYVPLKTGEFLVLDFAIFALMEPGYEANDNDWVISDWTSTVTNASGIVGEDAVL